MGGGGIDITLFFLSCQCLMREMNISVSHFTFVIVLSVKNFNLVEWDSCIIRNGNVDKVYGIHYWGYPFLISFYIYHQFLLLQVVTCFDFFSEVLNLFAIVNII